MLEILLALYIMAMVAMGILWAVVVYMHGGFQEIADKMEFMSGIPVTAEKAQWLIVAMTVLWWLPVGILIKEKFL